jgi:septum site-determining protein MinD
MQAVGNTTRTCNINNDNIKWSHPIFNTTEAIPIETEDRKIPGQVIVVTSGKGGVGKTTTTAALAAGLARLGKRVVAVDADTGLRNLDIIMGLESRVVYTLVDVIEGNCRLEQALIRDKRVEGLFLLPTAQTRTKDAVSEEQMRTLCGTLSENHDYVLIDCPAGIESGFRNASAGADRAIVIATPEVSSVRDADRITGLLEATGLRDITLLVNRLDAALVKKGDMLSVNDVLGILSLPLLGVVPKDESVIVGANKGEPVTFSGNTPAAAAYGRIVRRIEGEEIPVQDPSVRTEKGWLDRIFGFLAGKED